MSNIPYYGEEDTYAEPYIDIYDAYDRLSLQDYEPQPLSQRSIAGIDDLTPVDTFLSMQGDTTYVTEV